MADNNEIQDIESQESIVTPSFLHSGSETDESDTEEEIYSQPLFDAVTRGKWDDIEEILKKNPKAIYGPVGPYNETPLEVAIKFDMDIQIIENLVQRTPPEILQGHIENILHESATYWAIANRNLAAVILILSKNPAILYKSCDFRGRRPIQVAMDEYNIEMVHYLLRLASLYVVNEDDQQTDADAANRDTSLYVLDEEDQEIMRVNNQILKDALKLKDYDVASAIIRVFPELRRRTHEELWTQLIDGCDDLPCRSRLNMWQSIIYSWTAIDAGNTISNYNRSIHEFERETIRSASRTTSNTIQFLWHLLSRVYKQLQNKAGRVFDVVVPAVEKIRWLKLRHHHLLELLSILYKAIPPLSEPRQLYSQSTEFHKAVRAGMYDVVEVILEVFPEAIKYTNDEGINAVQFAISHRYGKTFLVLHDHCKSSNNEDILLSKDADNNNLLHLVAKKARRNRVGTGSREVLQLQHEFQWYKELEKLLPSDLKYQLNKDKKVPLEVFDDEHRDMLKSESEWLTSMSNSCMVAGSLIAAVVFAAAITLPGGNNDDGPPNFSSRLSFKIFAFSDAFALISSLTAVVTFLSIFTTRYSVESFQYDLPSRLIFGLLSLLLSVTFLMIAFCATVHLLLTEGYKWIIYPAVVVSLVPVFSFAYLQLPSIVNIAKSTYKYDIYKEDQVMRTKDD